MDDDSGVGSVGYSTSIDPVCTLYESSQLRSEIIFILLSWLGLYNTRLGMDTHRQ